mmetsp:Transcript_3204/g.7531  ORF Transcript_3204/g.7531 Transcript_3204/m.7531 type:complete len:196 (+) Transcript_3204:2-589(+)
MKGAICGSAGFTSQYHLSRPVLKGEKIDFFMSHSWHDDWVEKFKKLELLAGAFHAKHGRYPTFWLDKACVDQDRISDCLKVLPINVMACNKVLVLVGDTYATRLWCVWELFILFAFARNNEALEKVVVVPLHGENQLEGLESFDVAGARCYDPNEEARLLHVIEVVGTDAFNSKIRSLATMVRGASVRPMISSQS